MTSDDDDAVAVAVAVAPGFTHSAASVPSMPMPMPSDDDPGDDAPPPADSRCGGDDGERTCMCKERVLATTAAATTSRRQHPPPRDERRRRASSPMRRLGSVLTALVLSSIVSAAVAAVALAMLWLRGGHGWGIIEGDINTNHRRDSSSSLVPFLGGGSRREYSSLWIEMHDVTVRDPDDVRLTLGVEERRPRVDGGVGGKRGVGVGRTTAVTEEGVMNCSEDDDRDRDEEEACTAEGNDTGAADGRKTGAGGGVEKDAALPRHNGPTGLVTRPSQRHTQIGHHHHSTISSPWEHPASVFVPEVPPPSSLSSTTLSRSTEENHKTQRMDFFGPYADIRASLDYTYHSNYRRERQGLQDDIIRRALRASIVRDAVTGRVCSKPSRPWIAFTAGAMGVGKSHTVKTLATRGLFPLDAFVTVDPDDVRRHLPEFGLYARRHPAKAGNLTRKEAGYVSEVLTGAALEEGRNVLVDGSLRDWEWYAKYFDRLRGEHPGIRIAILHIRAPREVVFRRAAERSLLTGRVVPQETLEMALEQVPRSVNILAPLSDFFCELNNPSRDDDIQLLTEGVTWESFRGRWLQTCAD